MSLRLFPQPVSLPGHASGSVDAEISKGVTYGLLWQGVVVAIFGDVFEVKVFRI